MRFRFRAKSRTGADPLVAFPAGRSPQDLSGAKHMFGLSRRELFASGTGLLLVGPFVDMAEARTAATFPVRMSDVQWRRELSHAAYSVLRRGGTERPGSSTLDGEKRQGTFACAGCGNLLYRSEAKFESGTGWPSFFRALPDAIRTQADRSISTMTRTEVLCARCGGHLGHVFNDGPKPTGLRYCMNGVAMTFRPA
jgi:peptide-methionine (R)-S-oxide reductase